MLMKLVLFSLFLAVVHVEQVEGAVVLWKHPCLVSHYRMGGRSSGSGRLLCFDERARNKLTTVLMLEGQRDTQHCIKKKNQNRLQLHGCVNHSEGQDSLTGRWRWLALTAAVTAAVAAMLRPCLPKLTMVS